MNHKKYVILCIKEIIVRINQSIFNMKEIEVFIAGSKTLAHLRDSARAALMELNNQYREYNAMFRPYTFEDFPRSFTIDGRQADYNSYISNQADYVIFIFDDGFGDVTLKELDLAIRTFQEKKRPQIYVYCNEAKMNCNKFKEIHDLINSYGQYYIAYDEGYFKSELKEDFTHVLVESFAIPKIKTHVGSLNGCSSLSQKEKLVTHEYANNILSDDIYTVQVGNIEFNMIRVEGGTLEIGATQEQLPDAEGNEYPAHSITLPTYYIGQFPVTQNLWEMVMGYNHSRNQQSEMKIRLMLNASNPVVLSMNNMDCDKGHYPVENISLNDAKKFVNRLSELTKLNFDLPTEEEWEYAARGGQMSCHYRYAGSNLIDDVAWYRQNSDLKTHPVGEKQPNELGIYDMSGNVWEWTKSKANSYGSDISIDNNKYIRRGGSVFHVSKNCRVSFRYEKKRADSSPGSGLRVVIREGID